MKVHDDQQYLGAALVQIAEHAEFTAINPLRVKLKEIRNAYRVNNDIAVYLKYATTYRDSKQKYLFNFHKAHLKDLAKIRKTKGKVFIGLVCVQAREIACMTYEQLLELTNARDTAAGFRGKQHYLVVSVPKGKRMRIGMNMPGRKNRPLGEPLLVARTDFPKILFQ